MTQTLSLVPSKAESLCVSKPDRDGHGLLLLHKVEMNEWPLIQEDLCLQLQIQASQEPCRVLRSSGEAEADGQRKTWTKPQDKGAGEGQRGCEGQDGAP